MQKIIVRVFKLFSRKGIYPFLESALADLPAEGRVLSVGGDGDITKILRGRGRQNNWKVVTVDIDPKRNADIVADFCEPLPDVGLFDMVVLSEVLEHLHNPAAGIANAHGILKANGILVLTTPFLYPIHEAPFDYFRYTEYGLAHLLRDFQKPEIFPRSSWIETVWIILMRLTMERSRTARAVGAVAVFLAVFSFPVTWLLSKMISVRSTSSGYLAKARKRMR